MDGIKVELDQMLTLEQAAKWLGLSPRKLSAKSKGPRAKVPGFWLNTRTVRFHPRTVISKLARDAGLSPETLAASLGITPTTEQR
jgi:hypothetical protein